MSTPQPRARDGATLRIATWNLERPSLRGHTRNPRLLARLRATDADLWVLTETNRAIALDGYAALASPSVAGYHRDSRTSPPSGRAGRSCKRSPPSTRRSRCAPRSPPPPGR